MISNKHYLKKQGERSNENVMEGVNLFKVYCTQYGIITMKSPHIS
jgi:hypothetical protein